jgi:hypothetical protein
MRNSCSTRKAILCLALILSVFFFAAPASWGIRVVAKTPDGKEIPLYNNSYALVIGNGNYTKGWDPLPGAIRDVKDVARALEKNGFKVILKKDLTKGSFNEVFGRFCHKYGRNKNNRLLFYYAGHGHTQKMATEEDLGYLVMVDAPVPEKDPVGFELSSVDMQTMVTQAKKIKAHHVLFMFDSCFSGSILNLRERVVPQNISDSVKLPVRQFITAGRANEPVPDHSIFKQAFLDLLESRDKEPIPDGYITGEELGLYLKNKVPVYNPTQHPQYGKIRDVRLDKGDFVFALRMPPQPPSPVILESGGVRDYDKIIEEREATERKWLRWQKETEQDFAKAERYDESDKLTPKEKAEVWNDFLSAYGADNPFSTKDDKLRKKAEERVRYWKGYKVASIPEMPKYAPPSSISDVIERDGVYVAYANGIVRDTKTGLEWVAGPDKDMTWEEARSWVQSLNVDGGGWRFPTMDELEGLYNKGAGDRNMTPLLKSTGWWVWSGETMGSSAAWRFDFYDVYRGWGLRNGSGNDRAFAVRSRRQ